MIDYILLFHCKFYKLTTKPIPENYKISELIKISHEKLSNQQK